MRPRAASRARGSSPFAAPAAPAHVLGRQLLDDHDVVAGGQRGGGGVQLVGADVRHPPVRTSDACLGALPALGRPRRTGVSGGRGRVGGPRAAATPAAGAARPPAVWVPGPDPPPHRRQRPPPADPSHRHRHRPRVVVIRARGQGGPYPRRSPEMRSTSGPPNTTRPPTGSRNTRLHASCQLAGRLMGGIRPMRGSVMWWRSGSTRITRC